MNTNSTVSAVQTLIGILEQRIVAVDTGSLDQHLELLCNQPIPTEYMPLCQQLGCRFPSPPVLLPLEATATSSSSSSSSNSNVVAMEVVEETTVNTATTKATETTVVASNAGDEPPKKRGRGRPPKVPRPDTTVNANTVIDSIPSMGSSSGEDLSTAINQNNHESPGVAVDEKESTKLSAGTSRDALSKTGKGSDSKSPVGKTSPKDPTEPTSATKGGKKNAVEKEPDSTGSAGKKDKEEKGKSSARLSTSSTTSATTKTPTTTSSKKDKGSKQSKEEEDDEPRRSKRGR